PRRRQQPRRQPIRHRRPPAARRRHGVQGGREPRRARRQGRGRVVRWCGVQRDGPHCQERPGCWRGRVERCAGLGEFGDGGREERG
ncbi:hypothetical protein LTR03_018295, partial [Friedmanniomyces endolithicus]